MNGRADRQHLIRPAVRTA